MVHPEWWTRSLADAQERVSGDRSAFGEVVDSLVADLLTSSEFLSFLVAGTTARMAGGAALDQAVYAVTEEVAAKMQGEKMQGEKMQGEKMQGEKMQGEKMQGERSYPQATV